MNSLRWVQPWQRDDLYSVSYLAALESLRRCEKTGKTFSKGFTFRLCVMQCLMWADDEHRLDRIRRRLKGEIVPIDPWLLCKKCGVREKQKVKTTGEIRPLCSTCQGRKKNWQGKKYKGAE